MDCDEFNNIDLLGLFSYYKSIDIEDNLICDQLSGTGMPMNSFCYVYVFENGEITEIYSTSQKLI